MNVLVLVLDLYKNTTVVYGAAYIFGTIIYMYHCHLHCLHHIGVLFILSGISLSFIGKDNHEEWSTAMIDLMIQKTVYLILL